MRRMVAAVKIINNCPACIPNPSFPGMRTDSLLTSNYILTNKPLGQRKKKQI
uniref:Uncharacterized protein n=1 Tax=Nelumbo nucifera TaxID=4432 RepID=A0A822XKT4_NELNU|nr:TPA_asm: hypothetical protein HUJ06_021019 [Nelumbo nucifera]